VPEARRLLVDGDVHAHSAMRDPPEGAHVVTETVDDGTVGEAPPLSASKDRLGERFAHSAQPAGSDVRTARSIHGPFLANHPDRDNPDPKRIVA
jgi:hypothetical protein